MSKNNLKKVTESVLPKLGKEENKKVAVCDNLQTIYAEIFPSQTIRDYWQEIGFAPNLADAALILYYNHDFDLVKKVALMRGLEKFADAETKSRIGKYFEEVKSSMAEFQKDYDNAVFEVKVERKWDESFERDYSYWSEVIAKDFNTALFMAKRFFCDYYNGKKYVQIAKRRVVVKKDFVKTKEMEEKPPVYEQVGTLNFNGDGEIESISNEWENDLNSDAILVGSFCVHDNSEAFPNYKYISLPMPFHKGDVVKNVVSGRYGVISKAPVQGKSFEKFEKSKTYGLGTEKWFQQYTDIFEMEDDGYFSWMQTHCFYLEAVPEDRASIQNNCLTAAGELIANCKYPYALRDFTSALNKFRKKK